MGSEREVRKTFGSSSDDRSFKISKMLEHDEQYSSSIDSSTQSRQIDT